MWMSRVVLVTVIVFARRKFMKRIVRLVWIVMRVGRPIRAWVIRICRIRFRAKLLSFSNRGLVRLSNW